MGSLVRVTHELCPDCTVGWGLLGDLGWFLYTLRNLYLLCPSQTPEGLSFRKTIGGSQT